MLRFLTDSHVPPAVCDAFRKICPGQIVSLRDWHGGLYLHENDPKIAPVGLGGTPDHRHLRREHVPATCQSSPGKWLRPRGSGLYFPPLSPEQHRRDRPRFAPSLEPTFSLKVYGYDFFLVGFPAVTEYSPERPYENSSAFPLLRAHQLCGQLG